MVVGVASGIGLVTGSVIGSLGITRSVNSISTNTAAGSTADTDYVYFVSGNTTLTQEAKDLLKSIGEGSKPTFITKNLERIAKENGIEVTDKMSADDVINALKEKQSQPTVTNKEQIPNEPITEPVTIPGLLQQPKNKELKKQYQKVLLKLDELNQKEPLPF